MKCPKCGGENPPVLEPSDNEGYRVLPPRFCGNCAAKLTEECPLCEAHHPAGLRFCPQDGRDIVAAVVEAVSWHTSQMTKPTLPMGFEEAMGRTWKLTSGKIYLAGIVSFFILAFFSYYMIILSLVFLVLFAIRAMVLQDSEFRERLRAEFYKHDFRVLRFADLEK